MTGWRPGAEYDAGGRDRAAGHGFDWSAPNITNLLLRHHTYIC